MKKEDRNRADARFNKVRTGKTGNTEQDIATVRKASAKKKKPVEKAPALSEWLAGQQNGGRRT